MCYERIAASNAKQFAQNWDSETDFGQQAYIESITPSLREFEAQEVSDFTSRMESVVHRAGIHLAREKAISIKNNKETETGKWFWRSFRWMQVSDTFSTRNAALEEAFSWLEAQNRIEGECECCKAFILNTWFGSSSGSGAYCSEKCSEGK